MDFTFVQQRSVELGLSLHVVACEVMQALFLDRLYAHTESRDLHFHGGTSLRLLHGGYRFSEDLDFASIRHSKEALQKLMTATTQEFKKQLVQQWGPLEVELKSINEEFPVVSWWLNVAYPEYRGKFKVKLEIGHFPVHHPKVFPLQPTDLALALNPLVSSQALEESYADKINALAQRPFLKGRDLFDLWYLREALRVKADTALVKQKFKDYRTENPKQALEKVLTEIPQSPLDAEMNRFLPRPQREKLRAHGYQIVKAAAQAGIEEIQGAFGWR